MNIITKKSYIGQTINSLEERWYHHRYDALQRKHNYKFYNAIRKYGTECWNLETLEEVTENDSLNEREQYWISFYNSLNDGYNSTSGGDSKKIVSEETKAKMSKALKGRIMSEETRLKMKISQTGKKESEETKEKKRQKSLLHRHSEESKIRMSLAKKGHPVSEETRKKISEALKRKSFVSNSL